MRLSRSRVDGSLDCFSKMVIVHASFPHGSVTWSCSLHDRSTEGRERCSRLILRLGAEYLSYVGGMCTGGVEMAYAPLVEKVGSVRSVDLGFYIFSCVMFWDILQSASQ